MLGLHMSHAWCMYVCVHVECMYIRNTIFDLISFVKDISLGKSTSVLGRSVCNHSISPGVVMIG